MIKDIYQISHEKKLSQEEVFEEMSHEMKISEVGNDVKVEDVTEIGSKLKGTALRPPPLSTLQYIKRMIECEMQE